MAKKGTTKRNNGSKKSSELFNRDTQAFIYNMQVNAAQRMLDFDYAARRNTPAAATDIPEAPSLIIACAMRRIRK
jgi:hypothetical protein